MVPHMDHGKKQGLGLSFGQSAAHQKWRGRGSVDRTTRPTHVALQQCCCSTGRQSGHPGISRLPGTAIPEQKSRVTHWPEPAPQTRSVWPAVLDRFVFCNIRTSASILKLEDFTFKKSKFLASQRKRKGKCRDLAEWGPAALQLPQHTLFRAHYPSPPENQAWVKYQLPASLNLRHYSYIFSFMLPSNA